MANHLQKNNEKIHHNQHDTSNRIAAENIRIRKENQDANHYEADGQYTRSTLGPQAVPRPIHNLSSTQLPSNLKEINDQQYGNIVYATTKRSMLKLNNDDKLIDSIHTHNHNLYNSHNNSLKRSNTTKSTKSTLNASAIDFVPKGCSNKTSSKCKVMETITEQYESHHDTQFPNGNDHFILSPIFLPKLLNQPILTFRRKSRDSYVKNLVDEFTEAKIKSVSKTSIDDCNQSKCQNNGIPAKLSKSVSVSKRFTQTIIPQAISDQIHDIYRYMDKSMALDTNKLLCKDKKTVIINFAFHEKKSNEELFCIIKKQNSGKNEWGMMNQLFTAKMIEDKYGIPRDELPSSLKQIHDIDVEKQALKASQLTDDILDKQQWHKTPVHDKINNKQRTVSHYTKSHFIKAIKNKIKNSKQILQIITIKDGKACVENVIIIDLMEDTSIGISYSFDRVTNKIKITGIYLDKNELLIQHQMASLHHDCHCLDNFVSNIDDLKIGNVYNERNQINALRKENKKLRDENKNPLIKYIKKVLNDLGGWISSLSCGPISGNMDITLSAIKKIFNIHTIKKAIKTYISQKKTSQTITTNIATSNPNNTPISYLTTIYGSYATTKQLDTLLPPPSINAGLRSIPKQ